MYIHTDFCTQNKNCWQSKLQYCRKMASKNVVNKSYIGMGYHNTMLPPVIAATCWRTRMVHSVHTIPGRDCAGQVRHNTPMFACSKCMQELPVKEFGCSSDPKTCTWIVLLTSEANISHPCTCPCCAIGCIMQRLGLPNHINSFDHSL